MNLLPTKIPIEKIKHRRNQSTSSIKKSQTRKGERGTPFGERSRRCRKGGITPALETKKRGPVYHWATTSREKRGSDEDESFISYGITRR